MDNWLPLSEFTDLRSMEGGELIPEAPAQERDLPAWEHRESMGVPKAALETIKSILLDPVNTYARMKRTGGWMNPALFAVGFGTICFWISAVIDFAFQGLNIFGADETHAMGVGMMLLITIVLTPFFLAAGIFIATALCHLCLMLVGGANQPVETTFRTIAYANGATAPLHIVPICGSFVGGIYYLVLAVIGLAKTHETEVWKAVVAVLAPIVICCGLIVGLALTLGVGAAALGGAAH